MQGRCFDRVHFKLTDVHDWSSQLIENAKFSTKIKDGHLTENTTYSVRVDLTGLYICVVLMLTKHLYLQNGLT